MQLRFVRIPVIVFFLLSGFSMLNAQVSSPDVYFGYSWGSQFTPNHRVMDYFEYVADNSDLVMVEDYGKTNEGRPLKLAFISTPENLTQLEEIRTNNLTIAGIIDGQVKPSITKSITWISCSVHGNEAAGTESASMILYRLITDHQDWLENTVVILDPSINPDGNARYTSWYNRVAGNIPNVDPSAREHREPWPGGRTNHYYFDLNRDWAWQTQIESKQRMKVYHQWLPHIHVDLHEQGVNSPYYFAPAAKPYHEYITPWQRSFQTEIGKNHAKYFDPKGWLYFTKEVFDLLYPSYGDTYPTYLGGIGMTYEQGGSGRAGRAILMSNGDTLTLLDRVQHHLTTSLSTVEMASKNQDRLVENFANHFEKSRSNPPGAYKSFIIKKENPKAVVKAFCELLDKNGIQYGISSKSQSITGYDYQSGEKATYSITNEDLVISAYQHFGTMAQILLEPEPTLEDSLTYDITAWSLIHAYGLDAMATTQRVTVDGKYEVITPSNKTSENAYAILIPWNALESSHFLGQLLQLGIKARFANQSFTIDGKSYERGTIIINRADNRKVANAFEKVIELSKAYSNPISFATTGFVESGADFGSRAYPFIEKPVVATMAGDHVRSYSFGQLWHHFDQTMHYPLHVFEMEDIEDLPFDQFNTLVLVDGWYSLNEDALDQLKNWIRNGGHLILIGSANQSFAGESGFQLENPERVEAEETALPPYEDQARWRIQRNNPGAILQYQLDHTHPLAYGLGKKYFSLKTNRYHFPALESYWNVATTGEELLSLGFMGHLLKEEMKEKAFFSVQEMGRGHVTYCVDNPLFRAFWYRGKMLFNNAIFLVGQ